VTILCVYALVTAYFILATTTFSLFSIICMFLSYQSNICLFLHAAIDARCYRRLYLGNALFVNDIDLCENQRKSIFEPL
jgi:hypothetical protein